MLTNFMLVFAQEGGGQAPQGSGGMQMIMLLLPMFLIFYFIMIRPQSKERKQREAMINALQKNDRVVTIGGIVGIVTAVRDDEITLKVDESSNTKITFTRSAVQRVTTQNSATKNGGDKAGESK